MSLHPANETLESRARLDPLRAFPVEFFATQEGIVLKRGRIELSIVGVGAKEITARIFDLLGAHGLSRMELRSHFPESFAPAVDSLINELLLKNFIAAAQNVEIADRSEETERNVFYWHFGTSERRVAEKLANKRVVVVGLNGITIQLVNRLLDEANVSLTVLNTPTLKSNSICTEERNETNPWARRTVNFRNVDLRELDGEDYDCLVATCDFGGQAVISQWNKYCNRRGLPFLPVLLWDLIGYVGPLVIPGETACFDCLLLRQDSHTSDPALERLSQRNENDAGLLGVHPALTTILGELAAIELIHFYGIGWPWWRVGTLIELNIVGMSMKTRKVLKMPRCPTCSRMRVQAPVS
jgi:molybdopterin-synthase adenylyltransferase